MLSSLGLDYSAFSILGCSGAMLAVHMLLVLALEKATANKKDSEHAVYLSWGTFVLLYCVVRGWDIWLSMDMSSLEDSLIYTRVAGADDLTAVMCIYQVYNLLVCMRIPTYRTPEFLGHHAVTALLCWFALDSMTPTTGYCIGFYGVYFLGVAETSNLLLSAMDIFKYNLFGLQESCPTINTVCRLGFCVFFIILRLILWPIYSFSFWKDNVALLMQGQAHNQFVAVFYLIANAGLTFLQFLWGQKVLQGLVKFFGFGGKKAGKKSE